MSCDHGVGRWCDDCGCSTGGGIGWNQKWRKPLREALDYVRDELIKVYEEHASHYLHDIWDARNDYINVILDRCEDSVHKFLNKYQRYELSKDDIVNFKDTCMKIEDTIKCLKDNPFFTKNLH